MVTRKGERAGDRWFWIKHPTSFSGLVLRQYALKEPYRSEFRSATVKIAALRVSFSVMGWGKKIDGDTAAPAGVRLGCPTLFRMCNIKNNLLNSYHT